MLAKLADELQHRHVRPLIARGGGQVRDVLQHVIDDPGLEHFYFTVQAAVDAAAGSHDVPPRRRRPASLSGSRHVAWARMPP